MPYIVKAVKGGVITSIAGGTSPARVIIDDSVLNKTKREPRKSSMVGKSRFAKTPK